MIRIALVDDAVEIGTQLEAILIEITTNKGIAIDTDIYYSGKELCEHLQNGEFYDLIFLDIEMPEFTGIDVSKTILHRLRISQEIRSMPLKFLNMIHFILYINRSTKKKLKRYLNA